jgi:hypothetical protein
VEHDADEAAGMVLGLAGRGLRIDSAVEQSRRSVMLVE